MAESTATQTVLATMGGNGQPQILTEILLCLGLDDSLGHSQLIVRADDGRFTAASDPRSEGAAVVLEG